MYLFHTTEQALRFPGSAGADRARREDAQIESDRRESWGVVLATLPGALVFPRPAPADRAPRRAAQDRGPVAAPACAVARG